MCINVKYLMLNILQYQRTNCAGGVSNSFLFLFFFPITALDEGDIALLKTYVSITRQNAI